MLSAKIVETMGLGSPYVATPVADDRDWPNPTYTDTKKVTFHVNVQPD